MPKTTRPTSPLHGTERVMGGKLRGTTDTDYFYFFCPECEGQEVLRVLHFTVNRDDPPEYAADLKPKKTGDFVIAFELYCQKCSLRDTVKISNVGWQGGQFPMSN